jgi:hypothetical protein
MCKHEEKNCPCCNQVFECKVGDVINCQCNTVKLTDAERDYIAIRFTDCLCANCMATLKNDYNALERALQLKTFFTGR